MRGSRAIVIFFFLLSPAGVFAQEKVEREIGLKVEEVNAKALSFIQKANFRKRVRWFLEYGDQAQSQEAKVKFKRHLFSIEFDTKGNLQDIEQKVRFRSLPISTRQQINKDLEGKFDKIRILKTQSQWLKEPASLLPVFNAEEAEYPRVDGYELEVEAYHKGTVERYEVNTDSAGQVLKVLRYVTRPTDNLDF